jgi:hypothetical protein
MGSLVGPALIAWFAQRSELWVAFGFLVVSMVVIALSFRIGRS